jgi:hypothetical protein
MPQMRPASGRDQVMILHFLFAVKEKVVGALTLSRVDDTRVAQPPSAVALAVPLPFSGLRGAQAFGRVET